MLRWRDIDDADLIRFRCAECGKVLGAKPGMPVVVCSRCQLDNDVPTPREAEESLSNPVRLVSPNIPLPRMLWLGTKVAIAAVPLVLLLAVAACGVVWFASGVFNRPAERVPDQPVSVTQSEPSDPSPESPQRYGLWVGVVGVPLVLAGAVVTASFVFVLSQPEGSDPPAYVLAIRWLFLGFVPLALGGVLCWRYFF